MSSPRFPDQRPDPGQSVVEFALTLPLIVVAALILLEIGLLVHVCRDATRQASIATDPVSAARHVVLRSYTEGTDVEVRTDTTEVRVTISVEHRTRLPIVGVFIPDIELHESLTMGWEGAPS
jgi:hypothetical protein